jgi:3,4-dihydroxy 2-butanone 4-phosphate synthase/GTP cyclohydrolase II
MNKNNQLNNFLSPIEEIVDEARNGRMFVLVDNEDRENEGDLIVPAQMATPDAINFLDPKADDLTMGRVKRI